MNTRHEAIYRLMLLAIVTIGAVVTAHQNWVSIGVILIAWFVGFFALVNGYRPEPAKDWRDIKAGVELTREVVDAKIAASREEADGNVNRYYQGHGTVSRPQ